MRSITNIIQTRPWFIFLLPIFLVLHIEKNYTGLIAYKLVWFPILLLFLTAALIYLLILLLTRDKKKSAAYTFLVLVPYYFFADVKDWLHEQYPNAWFSRYIFVLSALTVLSILAISYIRRDPTRIARLFLFANLLLLISVVVDAGTILLKKVSQSATANLVKLEPCANCKRPDIYYLLFDAYPSGELLKKEFAYDNHDLDSFLLQKGFFIARNSKSNYNFTAYSMASIFNMDYVPAPDSQHLLTLRGMLPGIEKVKLASIFPAMESLGYKIYNHSIFDIKGNPTNTRQFDIWELSELYNRHQLPWKMVMDTWWNFKFLENLEIDKNQAEAYIKARDLNFASTIAAVAETAKLKDTMPKFVYAHSLIPHPPMSYDSIGNHVPFKKYTPEEDKAAFLQQLIFANSVIRKMVNNILSENRRECIIILQGDHAYRFFDLTKKMEEFQNLNAWYFPNRDYHLLNDSLTSVNSFRLLLNARFGQKLPVLKDSCIFLPYRLSF